MNTFTSRISDDYLYIYLLYKDTPLLHLWSQTQIIQDMTMERKENNTNDLLVKGMLCWVMIFHFLAKIVDTKSL